MTVVLLKTDDKKSPERAINPQIRGMTQSVKLLFSDNEILHQEFLKTDLGALYLATPFDELAKHLPIPKHFQSGRGCKPWFDLKGV